MSLVLSRAEMPLLTIQEERAADAPRTYRPHTTTKPIPFDWDALTPACKTCGTKTGTVNTRTGQCAICDPPEPATAETPRPRAAAVRRAPRTPRPKKPARSPGRPRLPLDIDAIIDAYTGGQSIPDIAAALRVDRSRVKQALLDSGTQLRDDRGRHNPRTPLNEHTVVEQYLAGWTSPQLAHLYDTTPKRIRGLLERHGVRLRDDRTTHSGSHPKTYDPATVTQVRELYLDQQLSQSQVAAELGLTVKIVQTIMARHTIPGRKGETGHMDGAKGLREEMAALGLTARQIKAWALEQGLIPMPVVGIPSRRVFDAYVEAHQLRKEAV